MQHYDHTSSRRGFLRAGAATIAGLAGLSQVSTTTTTTLAAGPARVSASQPLPQRPNILFLPRDVQTRPLTPTPTQQGSYRQPYQVDVKTQPVQPEPRDVELYRLGDDPLEVNNLAQDSASAATRTAMANLLAQQRAQKRLTPQTLNT